MSRRLVHAAGVVLVLGLLVVGWLGWSARTAGEVAVTWAPGSPVCEGTEVRRAGTDRPVIEAVEGMRCVVSVEVTNGSGRDVHLSHAVAPYVGPGTGAVVAAEDARAAGARGNDDLDHLVELDEDLPAGGTTSFEIVVVLHPRGCNAGATVRFPRWPTVTVDVLGRSFDRRGDRDFAFHRDGRTPGCSRHD